MAEIFHGFELLLLKKFDKHPEQWRDLKQKLANKESDDQSYTYVDLLMMGNIPQSMWFLSVALHNRPKYLLQLILQDLEREKLGNVRRPGETLLKTYLNTYNFTEFHLDSIFKYGEDNTLPKEIFKCPNVKLLSLKYNCLDKLPVDIGRMKNLRFLALTNNKLQVQSIPYSLTFCRKLKTLMLDNNLLDALPGFLLKMPAIRTVHRHGNHNYFKSTFMWYHTDVGYRIIPSEGAHSESERNPRSLQFWAAKTVIGMKIDFFEDPSISVILQEYLSEIYHQFKVCHYCNSASFRYQPGYKVITFKNPYLGNTCVPFQHWACTISCAVALEVPARQEQIAAAARLDNLYEEYIDECQTMFHDVHARQRGLCGCICTSPPPTIRSPPSTTNHSNRTCAVS